MKLERVYTIPLGDAYEAPRNERVPRAMKIVRAFIGRHMKADGEKIAISAKLNELIWARSIQKPPRRVKVRLIKEDGRIDAYLHDEKIEAAPKKEEPKEDKKAPAKEEKSAPAKDAKPEAKSDAKEEAKPSKEGKPAPAKAPEAPKKDDKGGEKK